MTTKATTRTTMPKAGASAPSASATALKQVLAERDQLKRKLQDVLSSSATEYAKLIDHIEKIQHLRFAATDVAQKERELEDVKAALAHEQSALHQAQQEIERLKADIQAARTPAFSLRRLFFGTMSSSPSA